MLRRALTALVVAAAATPAWADLRFGQTINPEVPTWGTGTGVSAYDNTYWVVTSGSATAGTTFTAQVNFGTTQVFDAGVRLLGVYADTDDIEMTLTHITWVDGALLQDEWDLPDTLITTGLGTANKTNFTWTADQVYAGANATPTPNFNWSTISSVILTFNITATGGGHKAYIDAIANPEPGTMALFGLAAAGLGGAVWRRRRARRAVRTA